MTIKWNLFDEIGSDRLVEALVWGQVDPSKDSSAHFTMATGNTTLVFDGAFNYGNPNSPSGQFSGFHVYDDGKLIMEASGYDLSVADLFGAVAEQNGDVHGYAIPLFLSNGPMNIVGSPGPDSQLTGSEFRDTIRGGLGGDQIYGHGGRDKLLGGRGSDFVSGGGNNDTLTGGKGADELWGNAGRNTLTGGSGNDRFVFDDLTALNKVTDFSHGHDKLVFAQNIFTDFDHLGGLKAGEFRIGSKALDGNDHLIYNASNGALSYDADGAGGAAQVKVGVLDAHLPLTHKDFLIEYLLA